MSWMPTCAVDMPTSHPSWAEAIRRGMRVYTSRWIDLSTVFMSCSMMAISRRSATIEASAGGGLMSRA